MFCCIMFRLILILVLNLPFVIVVTQNESQLLMNLFKEYNTQVRPVIEPRDQVQVEITFNIRSLKELNTKEEILSVVGWVSAYWEDKRLKWNTSEYGGIDYIAISPTELWMPTFVLGNSASSSLYIEEWYKYFKVKIFSDGTMIWSPGGIFTIECTIDVTYFPFDDQICVFRFENWVYTGDKVNLSYRLSAEDSLLENYIENGQWDIRGVKVMRRDVYYASSIPYPEVVFGIHFHRKILFYVTNIILLSLLIGVLVLHTFKLPVESGEKISMGVTLLLAFSVFILMVNESIPETSTAVPVIIIYLVCIMAVTTLSICESVLVLYCYHHRGEYRAPTWLLVIIVKANYSCFNKNQINNTKEQNHQETNSVAPDKAETLTKGKDDLLALKTNQDEWQQIGRFIDKFSFWFFVSLFLLLILILIIIVPYSQPNINIQTSTKDLAGF